MCLGVKVRTIARTIITHSYVWRVTPIYKGQHNNVVYHSRGKNLGPSPTCQYRLYGGMIGDPKNSNGSIPHPPQSCGSSSRYRVSTDPNFTSCPVTTLFWSRGHLCIDLNSNQQHGAAEARRAHNPEVPGSKPGAANNFFFFSPLPD
jgi:hypothetical protein